MQMLVGDEAFDVVENSIDRRVLLTRSRCGKGGVEEEAGCRFWVLDCCRLGWVGLGWVGLVWVGWVGFGFDCVVLCSALLCSVAMVA